MTDIDPRIVGLLHDEADKAALPDEMYQRVLGRARIRRLVTATVAGVAMIAIIMTGVMIAGQPRSLSNVRPAGPEELPAPPDSLRQQVPDELDYWIAPGLVLLYMNGGVYHLYFEGVMPHSCPVGLPERDPEACFFTAQHLVWGRATPDASSVSGDHDLELPELTEDAEVLWRGSPDDGSIGVRSPGACARITRFDDYYECRDGVPVYVRREERVSGAMSRPQIQRTAQHSSDRGAMRDAKPKRPLDVGRRLKGKPLRELDSRSKYSPRPEPPRSSATE